MKRTSTNIKRIKITAVYSAAEIAFCYCSRQKSITGESCVEPAPCSVLELFVCCITCLHTKHMIPGYICALIKAGGCHLMKAR